MPPPPTSPALDHLILLLPHTHLLAPPAWLTSRFTLTPGGRHADGKTENTLIVLRDGVYIELIAFIDDAPARRHGHWWGDKPPGWIDWALISRDVDDVEVVRRRLRLLSGAPAEDDGVSQVPSVEYAPAVTGGRTRPDDRRIEWAVTFPRKGAARGTVPFWCHDVTPRGLRVPSSDAETGTAAHPCGASAVASLTVVVVPEKLEGYVRAYAAIVGRGGDAAVRRGNDGAYVLTMAAPDGVSAPQLVVREPGDEAEVALLKTQDAAIAEVALRVHGLEGETSAVGIREAVGDGEVRIVFVR